MSKWKLIKDDYRNLWYFWQGTIRYFFYKNFPFMVRKHIKEQFIYRLKKSKKCVMNGSCLVCGSKTPDLLMADQPCAISKLTEYNRVVIM